MTKTFKSEREEFNLSEKIFLLKQFNHGNSENKELLQKEDVKEFIKRLKEKLRYNVVEEENFIGFTEQAFKRDIEDEIDKLVGEKLC